MSAVVVSSVDWRASLDASLRLRNRVQRENPKSLIESYNSLLDRYNAAKSRIKQLEQSENFSRNHSFVSQPQAGSAEYEALRSKISSLQEELSSAWRLQAENSATSLRLKEAAERDERELMAKEEECNRLKTEAATARQALAEEKESRARQEKLLESTLEVVRREYQTIKQSYTALQTERDNINRENEQLLSQIIKTKQDHVRYVNEMNELVSSKRGGTNNVAAPMSSLDTEAATAQLAAQREAASKARAELLQVTEVDLTSSSSIIDALSWQQNFRVTVPKELKRSVKAHRGQCLTASISPSGATIVTGGTDGYVKLVDARTGFVKAALKGSKDSITCAVLNSEDTIMLAAGNDQTARLWALKPSAMSQFDKFEQKVTEKASSLTSKIQDRLRGTKPEPAPPSPTPGAAFVPRVLHTFLGHSSKINTCCLDGSLRAITGSHDRTIRLWDLNNGSCVTKIMCGSACNALSLSQGRGLELIASAHLDSHLRFFDASSGQIVKDLDDVHHQQVTSVEFSRDGQLCVSNSRDNTLKIVDTRTWRPLHSFEGPVKDPYRNLVNFNRACFSPDGQYVAAGGAQGSLYVWAVDSGRCMVSLNPDENYVASAHDEHSAHAPETAVSSVDWNKNGRQVVSTDLHGYLRFWENNEQ